MKKKERKKKRKRRKVSFSGCQYLRAKKKKIHSLSEALTCFWWFEKKKKKKGMRDPRFAA